MISPKTSSRSFALTRRQAGYLIPNVEARPLPCLPFSKPDPPLQVTPFKLPRTMAPDFNKQEAPKELKAC